MTILDQIIQSKKKRLTNLPPSDKHLDVKALKEMRKGSPSFLKSIKSANKLAIIAEAKQKSPSKGIIRTNYDVVEIALSYAANGANCMSVLTEEDHFGGSSSDLELVRKAVELPILRKDFIIDAIQITESLEIGADAILLVKSVLDDELLIQLYEYAISIGLDVLLEIHTEAELSVVQACPQAMIGINNRNLDTFDVDLGTTHRLRSLIDPERIVVSESGIKSAEDIKLLNDWKVNGALIGEAFMKADDPGLELNILMNGRV
ncbi:MAG: indole-3-glycerol phosphate synthase [Candidatus Omnitrophota bacterium]|jgi:indole-3-glycerol phosphate synthase